MKKTGHLRRPSAITDEEELDDHFDELARVYKQTRLFLGLDWSPPPIDIPVTLKLVVGQVAVLSLSQVLKNLKQAHGKEINELYKFIYWQAWKMLDDAG